jgi:tetratricopeptide (TPR) repeat protein
MLRRRALWAIAIAVVAACSGLAGVRALESWRRERDATAAEAALKAAKAALDARSPEAARPLLARASQLRGGAGNGEAEFLLGACEFKLGHPDAAEAAWSRVPAGSPFEAHAALYRARLVLSHDRFADAEPLLLTALRGQGTHATEARETLVNLYKIQGRFDEARALVLGAWGSYSDPAGLLKEVETLGSSHPMGFDKIRTALDKASRNAPDDDRIWLGWATLATRTGHLADAKRRLDQCLERRPSDAAVWKARLDWAMASEDAAELERAVRQLPPDRLGPAEVLDLRAWFAARAGDVDRERTVHEDLLAREPGSLRSLDRLATLALLAGRRDEAARLRQRMAVLTDLKYRYQTLLQDLKAPNIPEAARMAEELGRTFEAYALWTLVAKADPNDRASREAMDRLKAADARRPAGPTLRDLVADLDAMPSRSPATAVTAAVRVPEFLDDAEAVGLRFTFDNGVSPSRHMPETTAGGVGLLDYDGDGWLDVYLPQAGPFPPDLARPRTEGDRLFRNRGDGTFEDATASAGLAAFARGYSHGVTVGDVDNDGHPDLFVTRWHRYALYRNRGDGTFEDATERYGLGGDRDWPTSAAFGDFDGDGDVDLYVCHYLKWDTAKPSLCWDARRNRYTYCSPQYSPSLPDHLFRNDGGRFTDVTAEAGIVDNDGRGLGVVAADVDGDGRLDIYVANDQTANFLFRNKGGFRFEDVGGISGVASSGAGIYQASMGVAHGDADGDGRPDLAVTNFYNESTTLYLNRGDGIFTDDTAASGIGAPSRFLLGFGAAFLDANNDGWLDLATANGHVGDFTPEVPWLMPAQLLVGTGGGRFADVSEAAGPPWRVPRLARGLAVGDLDNDGRVDLLIVPQNAPLAYFHNRGDGGHGLTLRLEGAASNRDAVGARVTVTAGGRQLTGWRIGGGSFQSASDPRLHFGLGAADRVEQIEVAWPSGRLTRTGSLAADAGYLLREGEETARPLAGFSARRAGPGRGSTRGDVASLGRR